ncbi:MAG TPA: ROK family protein [Terriglobales bacterium]|nr:ROK family protein [Terriglobales bacterium]
MPYYAFAADLGGTKCSAAVVDQKGRIVARETVPVDLSSPSGPVLQIRQLAKDLAGLKSPKEAYSAAAVAVPGLARPSGTVWAPNLPGWERMPLAARLKRSLGIPVIVESDRNAAVLGECWRGAAQGKSDAIVVIIGTGIGAGILSGGRIIRGAHELSGCAGWLVVSECDNANSKRVGQLESLTAGPGIARSARQQIEAGAQTELASLDSARITAYDVAAAARRGDQVAIQIFHNVGELLGRGLANLVSLFDPEIIVIGGGMAAAADLYIESLKQTMLASGQPLAVKQVKVAVSKLGDVVNLLGCARLAWEAAGAPPLRRMSWSQELSAKMRAGA